MNVTVRTIEPQPTMVVRERVAPQDLGAAFARNLHRVFEHVRSNGGEVTGHVFGHYLGMSDGTFDVEMGVPVRAPVPAADDIVPSELPGGEVAVIEYKGPYDKLGAIHDELIKWKDANGRTGGGQWESYVNDPGENPPEEWRTDVIAPLDPLAG